MNKMRRLRFILLLLLISGSTYGQQKYTISGKITDSSTGEDLIGASVLVAEILTGVTTNSYGYYSITLAEGSYKFRFSYLGYEEVEHIILLKESRLINIELKPLVVSLTEVTVKSGQEELKTRSAEMGVEKIILRDADRLPVFFGEGDILKTIQLLPGISSPSEGNTGFNIRGGSIGQNLILLDEATVYSSSHMMGFFSIFNTDALKDVTVYKGNIPAEFGGRLSSVIDITMDNGNSKNFSGSGGLGLISSRLALEMPLIKDKMSFIISGRRTYADLVAKLLFPEDIIRNDMQFYFYDLNAKLNFKINNRDRVFLSGYFGNDVFELGDDVGTGWGNITSTIRWNHLFSERLFSNSSLIYSKYKYGFLFGQSGLRLRSGIEDVNIKEDLTFYINPNVTLKFGINLTYHEFQPGELRLGDTTGFKVVLREKRALERAIYAQNEHQLTSRLRSNYGLRLSGFSQIGPGWFYTYDEQNKIVDSTFYYSGKEAFRFYGVEPRLAFNYELGDNSSLKLSYNRMTQYLHLLSNTTSGSPTDVWMPSSNNLEPLYADHLSAGIYHNFKNNTVEASAEVYYKKLRNATDYEDGSEIVFNEYSESQILSGEGRSYGLELFLKKKFGLITGWMSYSVSRAENRIVGINNSSWYPVKNDKTHDLSIVTIVNPTDGLTISGIWIYSTGNAVTFPSGKYHLNNIPVPYYTERNGYRMPPYHRFDLSITLAGRQQKRIKLEWDFSVYNLYNRRNAYLITFRESEAVPGTTEAVKLSLFGIVPSISCNIKF